jgi:hypothetical protein
MNSTFDIRQAAAGERGATIDIRRPTIGWRHSTIDGRLSSVERLSAVGRRMSNVALTQKATERLPT